MCKSKAFVLACIFFCCGIAASGQNNYADSLRQVIRDPKNDSAKLYAMLMLEREPAGQGTGLGLSLCYDMVKAQGGEIKLSHEGGGETEFIVELPT